MNNLCVTHDGEDVARVSDQFLSPLQTRFNHRSRLPIPRNSHESEELDTRELSGVGTRNRYFFSSGEVLGKFAAISLCHFSKVCRRMQLLQGTLALG